MKTMFISIQKLLAVGALALSAFAIGCATAEPTVAPTNVPAPTNAPASTNEPAPTTVAPTGGETVTLTLVPGASTANYRVREQLAGQNLPGDAVGKTSDLSGQIVGKTDGSILAADSKFVVNLATLQSDQSMRDGFIQRSVLNTAQFPNATFVPTAATGLPTTLPPTGEVSFQLTGDLTIRDVTKTVTWDATCQPTSATQGTCHARTTFTFADFKLEQPRVPRVLSIADDIVLEVDVTLQVAP